MFIGGNDSNSPLFGTCIVAIDIHPLLLVYSRAHGSIYHAPVTVTVTVVLTLTLPLPLPSFTFLYFYISFSLLSPLPSTLKSSFFPSFDLAIYPFFYF